MKTPRSFATLVAALVIVCAASCGGSSGTPTSPSQNPPPSTPGPTTPTTPAITTWTTEGVRFTSTSAGVSTPMADSTTLRLLDGRWRMFFFAGGGYRSAVSTDGLTFTQEEGNRLSQGSGQSRVIRLDDGRVRMFHISGGGISSSISTDEGLTFALEGQRISAAAAGLTQLSGPGLVRMPDGRWRMYFSELDVPGAAVIPLPMKSATSSDLLNWTMDPGVRVGPGATLSGSAAHPTATISANGTVTVYFFRNSDLRLWGATSADGLAFTAEAAVLEKAADPDVVVLPTGGLRMYYNWFDASAGTHTMYSAIGG